MRLCLILLGLLIVTGSSRAQSDPYAGKKKLLAIADVRNGYQHDSISHAFATIERLGYESGAFVTFIRTDTQLITKGTPEGGSNAHNLDYFDAIFFMGTGNIALSDQQKKDLLAFVHDDGKGFVGAHCASDAFHDWPEFGEMLGGFFDSHPWGIFDAPVMVEDPNFPAMKPFPHAFTIRDEIYVHNSFSREKVHVLASLDASKLDYSKARNLRGASRDFPVAWTKSYGKGRVFYSVFGHMPETWDNPAVQKMYLAAIKWALGME